MTKIIKILFFSFFIISCKTIDKTSYVEFKSLKNKEIANSIIYKKLEEFDILKIENKNLLIVVKEKILYKVDNLGNIVDSLVTSNEKEAFQIHVINLKNNFIATEDGYYPNWINNGDKTKKSFDKIYNQDLSLDANFFKEAKNISDSLTIASHNIEKDYEKYKEAQKKYYEFRPSKKLETVLLMENLRDKADYMCDIKNSYVFFNDNQVVKANFNSYLLNDIRAVFWEKGNNMKSSVNPQEDTKPIYFQKTKHKRASLSIWSSTAVCSGYWFGTAYYEISIGNSVAKLKVEDTGKKDELEVYKNFWGEHENFVFVRDGRIGCYIKLEN